MLEVRNQSGATIEVYALRIERDEYLGQVSPGRAEFRVADVGDLSVTYLAWDRKGPWQPTMITWRARRTRASASGIELTLRCGGPA